MYTTDIEAQAPKDPDAFIAPVMVARLSEEEEEETANKNGAMVLPERSIRPIMTTDLKPPCEDCEVNPEIVPKGEQEEEEGATVEEAPSLQPVADDEAEETEGGSTAPTTRANAGCNDCEPVSGNPAVDPAIEPASSPESVTDDESEETEEASPELVRSLSTNKIYQSLEPAGEAPKPKNGDANDADTKPDDGDDDVVAPDDDGNEDAAPPDEEDGDGDNDDVAAPDGDDDDDEEEDAEKRAEEEETKADKKAEEEEAKAKKKEEEEKNPPKEDLKFNDKKNDWLDFWGHRVGAERNGHVYD